MKRASILSLPTLLRPALFLASASAHTFSVHDDVLAFPQFELDFPEDYVTEDQAHARLLSNVDLHRAQRSSHEASQSQLGHYAPTSDSTDGEGGQKNAEEQLEYEYETMMLQGQRFLCAIPQISPAEEAETNATLSKAEEERELARATDRGWELLAGMQSDGCIYFVGGWWSYRFCYNEGVRQFHQLPPSHGTPMYPPQEDTGVEGYMLGAYTEGEGRVGSDDVEGGEGERSAVEVGGNVKRMKREDGVGELVQRGESRYLVQRLGAGTVCDLTGKERTIEIQYHCNQQASDRITLIKETSTCAYLMVVQTPRLCNDVAFLPPQKDHPHAVSCSPILAEEEVEPFEKELAQMRAEDEEAAKLAAQVDVNQLLAAAEQYPVFVGDMEVGARKILPADLKLEKSAILGGGKETLIGAVLSSDSHEAIVEGLDKWGVAGKKTMGELIKTLDERAKGKGWRVDVLKTARGREYRVVIGTDHEQDVADAGQGEDGKPPGSDGEEGESGPDSMGKATNGEEGAEEGQEGSQEEFYKEEL